MHIAIIGGGLCGLTAARRALELGADVELFESAEALGGLAKSFDLGGAIFDIGPHALHSANKSIVREVRQLLGGELHEVTPKRGIWRNQKLYRYPFHLGDFIRTSGLRASWKPVLHYLLTRLRVIAVQTDGGNMEEWAVSRFGRPLYEFYIYDHVRKNLGLPPVDLPALWGVQRIRIPTFAEAFTQVFEWKTQERPSYYPRQGVGQISIALAKAVTDLGGLISTASPVTEWSRSSCGTVLVTNSGSKVRTRGVDVVINTGPIDSFLLAARHQAVPRRVTEAARRLRYRSTIFVFMSTDAHRASMPCALCYFPEPEYIFNRAYTPDGYLPNRSRSSRTGICFEIHCDPDDAVWAADDAELIKRTMLSAAAVPFFGTFGALRAERVVRIQRHYPLSDRTGLEMKIIDEFLDSAAPTIISAGRLGSHRYVNMDNAMLMGIVAAEAAFGLRPSADVRQVADGLAFVEGGGRRR